MGALLTSVATPHRAETPYYILAIQQEPITRSLQLSHISVTAFSQTDLFLVWVYLEFRSPQEPQWPIAITSTD